MKFKSILALAVLSAGPALADPLDILKPQIEAFGFSITKDAGPAGLYQIVQDDLTITAGTITVDATGITLSPVTMREAGNSGLIQTEALRLSDANGFVAFSDLPNCYLSSETKSPSTLSFSNTAFNSDADDAMFVAETVTIEKIDLEIAAGIENSCMDIREVAFANMNARAADGSRAHAKDGSIKVATGNEDLSIRMEINEMKAMSPDPADTALASVGRLAMNVSTNFGDIDLKKMPEDLENLLASMIKLDSSFNMEVSNILIMDKKDIGAQGDMLANSLGLVTGGMSASLENVKGNISYHLDTDLEGMMRLEQSLKIKINEAGGMSILSQMVGDRPEVALLERLSFTGGNVVFEDKGMLAVMDANGIDKADILDFLKLKMSRAPEAITGPIMAFFSDALDGQAKASAAPAEPVGFTQIAMASLMSPSSLGSLLALSRN